MTKLISGISACSCDHRYKPVVVRSSESSPSTYHVKCRNCGKIGPGAPHNPYDSHYAAQQEAVGLWNDENRP